MSIWRAIRCLIIVIPIIIITIIFIILDFVAITITITIILNTIIIITTTTTTISIIIFINNFHQIETSFLDKAQAKGLNHFLTLAMSSRKHKKLHRLIIAWDISLKKSTFYIHTNLHEVHWTESKIFLLYFYDAYDVICEKRSLAKVRLIHAEPMLL